MKNTVVTFQQMKEKGERISMLTALGRDEEALDRIENYTHRAFLEKRMFGTGGDGGNAN